MIRHVPSLSQNATPISQAKSAIRRAAYIGSRAASTLRVSVARRADNWEGKTPAVQPVAICDNNTVDVVDHAAIGGYRQSGGNHIRILTCSKMRREQTFRIRGNRSAQVEDSQRLIQFVAGAQEPVNYVIA